MLCKGIDVNYGNWVYGYFCKMTENITFEDTGRVSDSYEVPCIVTPDSSSNICHKIKEGTECFYIGLDITSDSGEKQKLYLNDIVQCDDYLFVVRFGRCGENMHEDCGFQGFFFEGYDETTKRFFNKGLRADIHYWLNHYKPKVVGNIKDAELSTITPITINIKLT